MEAAGYQRMELVRDMRLDGCLLHQEVVDIQTRDSHEEALDTLRSP